MDGIARPFNRTEITTIGMGVGLLLSAIKMVGISMVPNSQGTLLEIFLLMITGGLTVIVYIFVKKNIFHRDVNPRSLMIYFEGLVLGMVGALMGWATPLFVLIVLQVLLTYAVIVGSVVFIEITEPIWGFTSMDYGSYIGASVVGALFFIGIGFFGIGLGRELVGKSPWGNKRMLKMGALIASTIGIVYGVVFAYLWTNTAFID